MSQINLLPWREQRRKEQQKEFGIIAGLCAAVAVVAVFFAHVYVNGLIEHQEARNSYLQNEIRILDRQIAEIRDLEATRQALIDRMNVIQELQASRPVVVRLFDEMVTTLPDGTYLTLIEQRDANLTIRGRAESNARISAMMRNLEASPWFGEPTLNVIETREANGVRTRDFSLRVGQTTPGSDDDEEDTGA
ncbi:PilN domain-containing protein [Thioalkalivibrio thiocyanodenitrificans]|uniref:PilN domain-containing protein n=1 Tax=Thioalkalivibrio thiocyanodenitrificans TaxID=243063 RepID=UPI00037BD159|nr:PilN domain-containing protein [Thioalkalivibrio thiocyanodenitrificans]